MDDGTVLLLADIDTTGTNGELMRFEDSAKVVATAVMELTHLVDTVLKHSKLKIVVGRELMHFLVRELGFLPCSIAVRQADTGVNGEVLIRRRENAESSYRLVINLKSSKCNPK